MFPKREFGEKLLVTPSSPPPEKKEEKRGNNRSHAPPRAINPLSLGDESSFHL